MEGSTSRKARNSPWALREESSSALLTVGDLRIRIAVPLPEGVALIRVYRVESGWRVMAPTYSTSKRCSLYRSRTSWTLPERTTREWSMSAISSQTSSTEAMLCVEKISVRPSALRRSISRLSCSALTGSKPLKGSSKMSSAGRCTTVMMNCTFCCMPLESSSKRRFHQAIMSNRSNHSVRLARASAALIPFSRAK